MIKVFLLILVPALIMIFFCDEEQAHMKYDGRACHGVKFLPVLLKDQGSKLHANHEMY